MGFSLKRMFKPPKWVRKMKPLKVLGKVAPIAAALIPGVGPLAAAAIGAGGGLLSGGGIGGALKGAALGGLGSAALGGQGIKGFGGALGRIKGAAGKIGAGFKGAGQVAGAGVPQGGGVFGMIGRAGRSALDFARENPATALQYGTAGLGMIQGARTQADANARMEAATNPALAVDPGNPYAVPGWAAVGRPRRYANENAALGY